MESIEKDGFMATFNEPETWEQPFLSKRGYGNETTENLFFVEMINSSGLDSS